MVELYRSFGVGEATFLETRIVPERIEHRIEPDFVSVRSLGGTPLFRRCLQHLASVLQVVSRQRVVRFETQRLFAGSGASVVLPQPVVSRPDIIPGFRVTWPQGECRLRCRDRFRVAPFAITFET